MNRPQDIRLAVFGPGLLGGSLLHDARALGFGELRVWARRQESLDEVRALGLADFVSTDPVAVAAGANVLVLCVPVGGMKRLAEQLITARPAADAIFTDVGSVKGMVMQTVAPVFAAAGLHFAGSHPMAGSERTGLSAARAGLYQGAACILTPPPGSSPEVMERLSRFWRWLGCRPSLMDAAQHDEVVARISHLPHVAAVLTALVALRGDRDRAQYAAGGLRDTTRVASGDPGMWREILEENREAVLCALRDLGGAVAEFQAALEGGDSTLLLARLEEAKELRAARYG